MAWPREIAHGRQLDRKSGSEDKSRPPSGAGVNRDEMRREGMRRFMRDAVVAMLQSGGIPQTKVAAEQLVQVALDLNNEIEERVRETTRRNASNT